MKLLGDFENFISILVFLPITAHQHSLLANALQQILRIWYL